MGVVKLNLNPRRTKFIIIGDKRTRESRFKNIAVKYTFFHTRESLFKCIFCTKILSLESHL